MASNRVLQVLVEGHSFLARLQRGWCGEGVDGCFVLEWKARGGSKISHCVRRLSLSRLSAFDVVLLDIGGNDLDPPNVTADNIKIWLRQLFDVIYRRNSGILVIFFQLVHRVVPNCYRYNFF